MPVRHLPRHGRLNATRSYQVRALSEYRVDRSESLAPRPRIFQTLKVSSSSNVLAASCNPKSSYDRVGRRP